MISSTSILVIFTQCRSRSPPPRRRSSDRGRGRSRSRSPPPRRGPVSSRLGRAAPGVSSSSSSRDRLNDRLRDLARKEGGGGDYRLRDMDSRRDEYSRRDRDRDRPAATGYDRDRLDRGFRPFTKRPVW